MSELFAIESFSALTEPLPDALLPSDPRFGLEFRRRESILLDERNEKELGWLLKAAEFCSDTAQYQRSQGYVKKAIAAALPGHERGLARALLLQIRNCIAAVDGRKGARTERRLATLADGASDPFLSAVYSLAKGLNFQYSPIHLKRRQVERGASLAQPYFEEAVAGLVETGAVDLAIRAQIELARTRFELGTFFAGVDALEQATELAREGQAWTLLGRIILLFGSNASDLGYRVGVEAVIRRALAWCDYLGDAWGRIEARTVLGRFLYYAMPPDIPELAAGPDRYLQAAFDEADALGLSRLKATVDSSRFFLYRKAGDAKKLQLLLGDKLEEEEFRKKQALDNRQEIERIAERRRRATAIRLHDGVEDSPDAFFVFDAYRDSDGRCRDFCWAYMNRAAKEICDRAGLQVYLFSEAVRLPEFRGLEAAMLRAADQRQPFEDAQRVDREGVDTWIQRRVVPSGSGAVVTFRDVTAEKRIEWVLREAAESAKRSEDAKTAFLASMSHEIRTPLNGVLGLTRMLAETELTPVQRGYVDNIVVSGATLLDLIGDVLDLSKIEAQEMHLSSAPVFLPGLVASVVNLFLGQARERGIRLGYEIDASVAERVLADELRLRQILSNLVGNAVKFTEQGSVVVRVSATEGSVIFEVQDTGIGMAPDDLAAVFSRFKQAGNARRGGTGLGLAITKALAELMGGEVGVRSELGKGSVFSLRLPLPKASEPNVRPTPVEPQGFEGRRVLIVDDNQINLLVAAHAVKKLGCETVCASDGQEALDILAGQAFDIVYLDVQMPVLDGLAATRELRRRESGSSRTVVVALTAGALLQEQQACFEAGMDDFITKPVSTESFQKSLAKWLRRDHASAPSRA